MEIVLLLLALFILLPLLGPVLRVLLLLAAGYAGVVLLAGGVAWFIGGADALDYAVLAAVTAIGLVCYWTAAKGRA